MATYVFSDIHGHLRPLERVIERIAPSDDDRFFCLGDMIDRGPDPLGTIRFVRALPNVCVLSGNHEDLMLTWYRNQNDPMALADWAFNGGGVTLGGFQALDDAGRAELVAWLEGLPAYAVCTAGDRTYALAHAGIIPYGGPARSWDEEALEIFLSALNPQDLMWVRYEFWESATGLLDADGNGPIVVAGHTPTAYLEQMRAQMDRPVIDDEGRCQSVRVGDPDAHGGVFDKWNIDSGCAGGAGFGQVTVIRLDDGEEFREPIAEGE